MAFTGANSVTSALPSSSPPTLPRPDNTVKNLAPNPPRLRDQIQAASSTRSYYNFQATPSSLDGVALLKIKYFETIPLASSLCILKSGFLFATSEFGNHHLFQFEKLGDDDEEQEFNSNDFPTDPSTPYDPVYYSALPAGDPQVLGGGAVCFCRHPSAEWLWSIHLFDCFSFDLSFLLLLLLLQLSFDRSIAWSPYPDEP
ncbi:hypothetical protein V8F06_004922 [Rhypophila decipiens]